MTEIDAQLSKNSQSFFKHEKHAEDVVFQPQAFHSDSTQHPRPSPVR